MANHGKGFWDENRIATLKIYWRAGYTGSELAEILGCSRSQCLGKLNRLGMLGGMAKAERSRRQSVGVQTAIKAGRRDHVARKVSEAQRLRWRKWHAERAEA